MAVIIAFLVFRIVIAWFFLKPVKSLCANWKDTVEMVKLVFPFYTNAFAVMMVAVMVLGSLSVLFGFYAQVGATFLFVYSLIGFFVHTKLKNKIMLEQLRDEHSSENEKIFNSVKLLGVVGHATSAEKNIVIAAALLIIVLLGSGPYSLTGVL